MTLTLYHGTSAASGRKIEKEGFVTDTKYNWAVKSKKGFVYLSSAYGPFYAMTSKNNGGKLALVKCTVDEDDCYPEDDFLMHALGKPKYTQRDLDKVNLEDYKQYWRQSLDYMGNVAVHPEDVNVVGVRVFDGSRLLFKCDPVVSPMNYKFLGNYYKELTEWIYEGNDFMKFERDLIG